MSGSNRERACTGTLISRTENSGKGWSVVTVEIFADAGLWVPKTRSGALTCADAFSVCSGLQPGHGHPDRRLAATAARCGRAAPMPATWRKRSATAGGEEQHEPGGSAVEYVEASFVEEPFHFAAGIDAQPARPHERGGRGPAEARLLRRHQCEAPARPQRGGDTGEDAGRVGEQVEGAGTVHRVEAGWL